MLERLGIEKLAYDWRDEHIPTFDAEVAALKRHGVEMTARWFSGALDSNAVAILDCIKRSAMLRSALAADKDQFPVSLLKRS